MVQRYKTLVQLQAGVLCAVPSRHDCKDMISPQWVCMRFTLMLPGVEFFSDEGKPERLVSFPWSGVGWRSGGEGIETGL